jgi:hypothetical protein
MSLSVFPSVTRIRFCHHNIVAEGQIVPTETDSPLTYDGQVFSTLEEFVEYVCNQDCDLSIWAAQQYCENAWEVCTFYKAGQWYPCKVMLPPPPPTEEVLEAVRSLQTMKTQEEFDPLPSPPPVYKVTHFYSETCFDTLQFQRSGDDYEVVFVPAKPQSFPISATKKNKDDLLDYLWTFLDLLELDTRNWLELALPGFPTLAVPTSTLQETKRRLHTAVTLSLDWTYCDSSIKQTGA